MGDKPTPLPRCKGLKTPSPFGRMSTSEEVRSRRKEYIAKRDFKIYIGTWNVDSLNPENVSLKEWLHRVDDTPDIYVVGLQEIDMDADTILWGVTNVMDSWNDQIMKGVHPGADYEILKSIRFVGMQLTVLIKTELKPAISECMTAMTARGALNIYGNKGGIGISFCFHESLFCFVNSHFAAHQHEYERRNEDFQEITNKMLFVEEGCKPRRILSHDHIFWLGDLNYRVEVKEFPDGNYNYIDFSTEDQLHIAMRDKKAFQDYQEGPIKFPPTYKYDKGGKNYDKLRIPSWCDRILWKSKMVFQTLYDHVPTISLSDHKPVFSYFLVTLEVQDPKQLEKVVGEVLRNNDKRENDLVPMLKVLPKEINFGRVKINDTSVTTIELMNTGFIPVVFELKNKSNEEQGCLPSWLKISDTNSCLLPGQRFNITFTVKIDQTLSNEIMTKYKNNPAIRKVPLDIIIMHVREGADIFLTIYFELLPSCFGTSFEQLCKMTKPLAKCRLTDLEDTQQTDEEVILRRNIRISIISDDLTPISAPKRKIPIEIFRLIDFLYKNKKHLKNLIFIDKTTITIPEPDDEARNVIRDHLDNWNSGPLPGKPEAAFSTLLKLLDLSPVPLLTITDREITATNYKYDLSKDLIMRKVCPLHRRIFLYICLFIQELRTALNSDKSSDLKVALIFAKVLIREKHVSLPRPSITANDLTYNLSFLERKRKFLLQFFTTEPPMDWVQKELFKS